MNNGNKELFEPLSEIAEINPPLPRRVKDDELVTFLGMAEVLEAGGIQNPMVFNYAEVKSGFTRFAEHDTLFAKITPCMENGKGAYATNLVNGIGCGSTEFHVLRAKENGDANFIYHVTMSQEFRQKAEMNMTGSAGQRRVPADFFREYRVYIPGVKSQKKIAKILTTIDQLIEKTQKLIDKHNAIKQGMMADLFTRGIDLTTGQLRPQVEQAPHLYKETELGWIPKDWSVASLGELSTLMTNGFVGVATPHYAKDEYGVRYLYGNNVRTDKLELNKVLRVTKSFHEKLKKSQLKYGDMLTVQSGHIGTSAIVPKDFGEANCHALIITRFIQSKVIPEFVSYYCNSALGMNRMEEIFVGSTIKHVNVKEFKAYLLPLPSLEEQRNFSKIIVNSESALSVESNNLKKYKKLKKGLMQDLLTGKVSV